MYAVHLRLSESPFYRRNHHFLKIAVNTVETLARDFGGQVFQLQNSDVIFVFSAKDQHALNELAKQIRLVFTEDPLTYEAGTGTDYEKLVKWYDLDADLAQFRVVVNRVATTAEKSLQTQKPHFGHPVAAEKKLAKLSSKTVGEVEGVLQTADISPYVRRQPVCVLLRDKPPVMVFEEIYVSIKDLRAQLFPKVDLRNARWLFQQLTLSLDRQVLVMLNRESERAVAKVSINLNVPTLLGDDFLKFDSNLKAASRGGIIIEINKVDVFYDLGAFRAARDFLRKRGYRVAIDGVTPDMLSMIDRENLEADFVKVFHHKDQAAEWQKPGVRAMIVKSGQARIIMSRCDSPDSVETGQGLGINLFQGYYVKKLLDAARHGAVPDSTRAIAGRKPAAALPGNGEGD